MDAWNQADEWQDEEISTEEIATEEIVAEEMPTEEISMEENGIETAEEPIENNPVRTGTQAYRIEYIMHGAHIFQVDTRMGTLSQEIDVQNSIDQIVLDQMLLSDVQWKDYVCETLLDNWNMVKDASIGFEDAEKIRFAFSDEFTEEDLEQLMKSIRAELGQKGNFEDAQISQIKMKDGIRPITYDIFACHFIMDYTSSNINHTSGIVESELTFRVTENGLYIIDMGEGQFFTLSGDTQEQEIQTEQEEY